MLRVIVVSAVLNVPSLVAAAMWSYVMVSDQEPIDNETPTPEPSKKKRKKKRGGKL